MSILLASMPKNMREEIRVTSEEFRGHDLVSIRVWFKADDGEVRPSKKGVTVRVEQFDELRSALDQAASAIKAGRAA